MDEAYIKKHYKGDKCSVCKKPVTIKNKSGKCRSCGAKGHKRNLGKVHTKEQRKAVSLRQLGENNTNWKGDSAGYYALHRWVEKKLKKPLKCPSCQKEKPLDLANKGVYDRNPRNWEWLCRKCHMVKDGRMEKLTLFNAQKNTNTKSKE